MKLCLDDIRNPCQSGYKGNEWVVCGNDKTFKDMFTSFDSIVTHISLDHDINSYDENNDEVTDYDLLKWLCDYILDKGLDISNLRLNFHTANVVGRVNMSEYRRNFKEHYEE